MLKKRIALIGAGAMGEAVIAGALRKKLVKPADFIAAAPREQRRVELHRKYGIGVAAVNSTAVQHADVVVIAVKPQRLTEVMKGAQGHPGRSARDLGGGRRLAQKAHRRPQAQGRGPLHAEHARADR